MLQFPAGVPIYVAIADGETDLLCNCHQAKPINPAIATWENRLILQLPLGATDLACEYR